MNDSDCVQVAVRIRPLVQNEIDNGCQKIIEKVENEPQVVVRGDHSFTYNFVFDPNDTQENIYRRAVCGNLQKLFMGYNVTILAYGQTGSGKTHTMGTSFNGIIDENIGVIPRSTYDIFKEIDFMSCEYVFTVKCSFMELYQEQLYDLLSVQPREQSIVDIREDSNKGIIIPGLTEVTVASADEIIDCLLKGSAGRAVGATAMNKQSSRSHAIFTVSIQKTKANDPNSMVSSKFHLVDLAGSERPKKTKATGNRFKEGVKINQGLLALGNVIAALGSSQTSGYVGYRDSKLTRLLQDSLGGNSITLMIACVSPADYNLDETLSTLRYADRAKRIKNKPVINQDPRSAEINRLNAYIEKLKLQLLSQNGNDTINVNGLCSNCCDNKKSKEMIELQNNLSKLVEKNHNLQQQLQITLNDVTEIEMRATLAEAAKEQFEQKLNEVKEAVIALSNNLDENKCKDHYDEIQKLLEIINDVEKVIEKSKEELADHKASFSALSSSSSLINHNLNTTITISTNHDNPEMQQKLDAFTSKQLHFNNELRKLNRELCLKEELHQKIAENLVKFCNYENNNGNGGENLITKNQEFEQKLKQLEAEREEINEKLNANKTNASAKISEERRKRLQQLELEINELKKKNLQQAKLLKIREKESQKIVNLSKEIQEMKAARVKLIREMKSESERFKQWKFAKEKEVLQLKEKDRKRENEFVRMKALHDKQRNVLKRKMEEAMAVNKRLKDALDKTKLVQSHRVIMNSGKIDQFISWIDHELDIILSVIDAEYSLEHLMEDRAILTNRLNEIKGSENTENIDEIKSIEEELNLRNAQISDLQQKILDSDIENKINHMTDSIQSMIEARASVKRLFTVIIDTRREYVRKDNKYIDIKTIYENNLEKYENLEKEYHELLLKHNEEKANIERNYEEKITILLKELNNASPIFVENNDDLTPEMTERIKIQQETLDKYEELREEHEKLKKLYEDAQKQLIGNNVMKKQPVNKRLTKLKEEKVIDAIESDQTFTEDEEDDTSNDPDWVKTPKFRRKNTRSQSNQTFSKVNASKRSSDGSVRCGCKQSCMTNLCSCKRSGNSCSLSCKCADTCVNNKSIKQEIHSDDHDENTTMMNRNGLERYNSTESSGSSDNKENIDNNTSSSDEHTPSKLTKLSTSLADKNIPTPSYPYLKKKRKPFYNN